MKSLNSLTPHTTDMGYVTKKFKRRIQHFATCLKWVNSGFFGECILNRLIQIRDLSCLKAAW